MNINTAKAKSWLSVAAGSVMAMSASMAQAATVEVESNDTFATANAGSSSIAGSIGDASAASNDVDIWSYSLNAGQGFSADITYTGTYNVTDVNPVMTLFMENGGSYYAVATTDPDAMNTSFDFTAWATGSYFLAISSDFNMAEDAFGNFATTAGFLSTEDTLGTAFSNFNGASFTSFDYEVSAVPVPAAVWLFGSGLLGLMGAARRRSHKA